MLMLYSVLFVSFCPRKFCLKIFAWVPRIVVITLRCICSQWQHIDNRNNCGLVKYSSVKLKCKFCQEFDFSFCDVTVSVDYGCQHGTYNFCGSLWSTNSFPVCDLWVNENLILMYYWLCMSICKEVSYNKIPTRIICDPLTKSTRRTKQSIVLDEKGRGRMITGVDHLQRKQVEMRLG